MCAEIAFYKTKKKEESVKKQNKYVKKSTK